MKGQRSRINSTVFAIFSVIIIGITGTSPYAQQITRLDVNNNGKTDYVLSIAGPRTLKWEISGDTTKDYQLETEKLLVYTARQNNQGIGSLRVILRRMEKGDYFYLIRYDFKQAVPGIKAIVTAVDANPQVTGHQLIYPREISNTSSQWNTFSVSPGGSLSPEHKLPKNTVFLDSSTHYIRLGLVDVFKPLKNNVRDERFDKTPQAAVKKSGSNIDYILPLPQEQGCFAETWGILSKSPLINWKNPSALNDAKTGDLVRFRKLSSDGIYYLTPSNYYPTGKTAFWRNPAYHVAELFRKQPAGNYFRDIAITSIYSAIETQTREGYWISYPRSDWLYHDYGIPEGFYDTRFNTDAAIFLLNMYKQYDDTKSLEAARKYAGWLRNYAISQGIATKGGGLLVPDYYKPGIVHKKTHVSLNHLINEMNFLYKLYLVDNDDRNLKTAGMIRQAVRDTGTNWIKPNGDLYYAYMGSGKYGMEDYPLVTLKDLRSSQNLIKEITDSSSGDPVFQKLLAAKETYLKKNNMPLQ